MLVPQSFSGCQSCSPPLYLRARCSHTARRRFRPLLRIRRSRVVPRFRLGQSWGIASPVQPTRERLYRWQVTVQVKGDSVQGLPLHYAFRTDAGQLTVQELQQAQHRRARATKAHVTCTAIDSTGRSASQVVEVKVLSAPHTEQLHIPQSGVRVR